MEVINDDHDYMDMQFYNILYTRAKNKFFYEKMVIYCEKWFLMYVVAFGMNVKVFRALYVYFFLSQI